MAGLIDQFGNPLRAKPIAKPIATPTVVGQRPAAITTPIRGLNPASLGRMMAAADLGDSWAWQCMAAEIERRDLHYLGVLGTRKRVVSQLPITVTPADDSRKSKKIADWVRDWVETGLLANATFDMLDAIGKGWSVLEIDWALSPGNNRPRGFTYRPTRWTETSWQDGETILLRSPDGADSVPGIQDGPPLFGFDDLPAQNFVIHKHRSWSGLTINAGLTRAVAWAVMFKMFTMRDWAVFVQNYGLPMRVGLYGPEASQEDRDVLWQAVTDIAGSCAAIMPKGMEVQFVEPKNGAGSGDLHLERVRFLDDQISKAVLGQTGTTDSHQGAHASSSTHRLVQEDIERADATDLSWTANLQVVQPMVDFTFGPQEKYPVVRIGRPDEAPLSEIIALLQWGGPQGLKIRAQDIYDRAGLTPPEDGDIVVGQTASATPLQAPEDKPGMDKAPIDRPGRDKASTIREPQATDQGEPVQGADGKVALHTQLGRLLELHVQAEGPRVIEMMTQRLAREAGRGLGEMTEAVRREIDRAESLDDLEARLKSLNLPDQAFADAMAQGIALAQLAGQAMVLDQVGSDARRDD